MPSASHRARDGEQRGRQRASSCASAAHVGCTAAQRVQQLAVVGCGNAASHGKHGAAVAALGARTCSAQAAAVRHLEVHGMPRSFVQPHPSQATCCSRRRHPLPPAAAAAAHRSCLPAPCCSGS